METSVMARGCPLCSPKAVTNASHACRLVFAGRGEEHPLADQIAKHAHVTMPLACAQLVAADANQPAPVHLRPGPGHMGLQHAPQPGVGLTDVTGHRRHRHLAHEQQHHRLETFGKVFGQALPWRRHPIDLARLLAHPPAPGQPTAYLAAMLKDVEVSPDHFLHVVVAGHRLPGRDALRLP